MAFKFCSECLLRVLTQYTGVWKVKALVRTNHRCRCGQWAEFETEATI